MRPISNVSLIHRNLASRVALLSCLLFEIITLSLSLGLIPCSPGDPAGIEMALMQIPEKDRPNVNLHNIFFTVHSYLTFLWAFFFFFAPTVLTFFCCSPSSSRFFLLFSFTVLPFSVILFFKKNVRHFFFFFTSAILCFQVIVTSLTMGDFQKVLSSASKSVAPEDIARHIKWTEEFGQEG